MAQKKQNEEVKDVVQEENVDVKEVATPQKTELGMLDEKAVQTNLILEQVKHNPLLANDPEVKKFLEAQGQIKQNEKADSKGDGNNSSNDNNATAKDNASFGWTNEDSVFSHKKEDIPDLTNFEDAISYIYDKYGMDTKKEGGFSTFFDSVNKWRNDAQKTTDNTKQLEGIQQSFENMPRPLYSAFVEWSNGRNWVNGLGNMDALSLDYAKPFEEQDKYVILNKYFPNEYEREDIENSSHDPLVKKAISLAKQQYEMDKNSYSDQRAKLDREAKDYQERLGNSASRSVDTLRSTFPDFSDSHLKEIAKILNSGELNGLFYTESGAYREDAAERLAFLMFGKDELSRVSSQASKKGKSDALKDVVSRGADTPRVGRAQVANNVQVEEVVKMMDGLMKKPTY